MLQPLRDKFQPEAYPDLLVGLDAADDAAVYRINERQAIVSTTDFFPPVVDDPYDFGAIAAANALSDVYAMGGRPLFAINLVAFPPDLDREILREILRGGAEKMAEAGAPVVGGHSVSDREPKYGLAVTGLIDPERILRKGGARPGDLLLLTKPLGTGVVTTALKREQAEAGDVAAAVASMKQLNRLAAETAFALGATAMTDVTGFGLLGHAQEMAAAGGVSFQIDWRRLPWLPGAQEYAAAGAFPGGMLNNQSHFAPFVAFGPTVPEVIQHLLWTPETSGGLLVALPPEQAAPYQEKCRPAAIIGQVTEAGEKQLIVDS